MAVMKVTSIVIAMLGALMRAYFGAVMMVSLAYDKNLFAMGLPNAQTGLMN